MNWLDPDKLIPLAIEGLVAAAILAATFVVARQVQRVTHRALTRARFDEALGRFLSQIVRWLVLAAGVIAAMESVGIKTTSLVAVLASAGLAVGLALQGSLSNFAAGVMILIFRPFRLGDIVTAGGHTGSVLDIGLFATTLATPDNQAIIVPNSAVMGGSIVNHTSRGTRRAEVGVGVAYGLNLREVIPVLEEAARNTPNVLADPPPDVVFANMGASSLDLVVRAWCSSDDYLGVLHDLRLAVYEALEARGIEIPFNQVVVHQAS